MLVFLDAWFKVDKIVTGRIANGFTKIKGDAPPFLWFLHQFLFRSLIMCPDDMGKPWLDTAADSFSRMLSTR